MPHTVITKLALLRSTLACSTLLVASLLGGCDDGEVQPRSSRATVVELIAEFVADKNDGRPAPIGEVLICEDEALGCDTTTAREINTICYCGYVPGKGVIYVETNCAGYPGTDVCCAAACSTGPIGDGAG